MAPASPASPFSRSWRGMRNLLRDVELLFLHVAGKLDHLQPVLQRRRHRRQRVGGGDKQHLRQIVVHVQVMVEEGLVLLRVEHFQQRRRRVAAKVLAQLVDLVQHQQRVDRAGPAHGLQEPAGQRADVGAAVAANLGLVAHAAQAERAQTCAPAPRRWSGPARSCPCRAGPTKHRMGARMLSPSAQTGARRYIPGCALWPWAGRNARAPARRRRA